MSNPKSPSQVLEKDIKFSNVTKFRKTLLGAVKELRRHPSRRFVITRGGEPQAVLISYDTYSLLADIMEQDLKRTAGQTRDEAIGAAFARLRNERSPAVPAQDEALTVEVRPCRPAPDPNFKVLVEYDMVNNMLRTIRRQVDELDKTLKKQEMQTSGSTLVDEK